VITGNGNELVIKCFRISFETSLDIWEPKILDHMSVHWERSITPD
jgi:hypothetical protein